MTTYKDKISTSFGDRNLREEMKNDPFLRGQWEKKVCHALTPTDHLINKIGINLVQAVEDYYKRFCETPNEANAKRYNTWRFRLHQRLKNDKALLDQINDARSLGLYDDRPGKTFWNCEF